ncbi:MAG: aquaporin [Thermoleophilia bacterium]|nr:aquaporin [Thermoleophilia bacterium]
MLVTHSTAAKVVSEFIGTAAFCAAGIGAVLGVGQSAGPPGLFIVAIAHGLAIAVFVTAAGHVSGGLLNPAATLALVVTRRIAPVLAAVLVVAQLAGAVAGTALVRYGFHGAVNVGTGGTPHLARGVSIGQGIVLEAAMTFFLMWVVFATAIDRDGSWFRLAGVPIGLVVTMDILMGGTLTGAAMNPAREFGPALLSGSWQDWWIYWVGPALGALLAAALYTAVLRPRYHDVAAR